MSTYRQKLEEQIIAELREWLDAIEAVRTDVGLESYAFIGAVGFTRERRERPAGYDRNPDAPGDPQVVSMNGTLASEAANIVLDLITGYAAGARGAGWWQYDGRVGSVFACPLPPRRRYCPACAEQGLGDPQF